MAAPGKGNVELTHFGRKSGKPFKLFVWFAEIEGSLWVGSRDATRNWVRNVEATGRADLDFGDGTKSYRATKGTDQDLETFDRAIRKQHPVGARVIKFMARGKPPCCFRLEPEA